MSSDLFYDLGIAVLKVAESNAATQDMLRIICNHIAGGEVRDELAQLLLIAQESNSIQNTESFCLLAEHLIRALDGDPDLPYLSLKKQPSKPLSPEELRRSLRLIHGGKEP